MKEFRHMRLSENQMSDEDARKKLAEASNGTLALQGPDGYPVTIPINYVFKDNKILFHGANEGQKFELIQQEPKASFCVILKDDIRPEYITSLYENVIVFGTVRPITDDEEKMDCLVSILDKYMPQVMEAGKKYIQDSWDAVACFALEIEHLTGKFGTE
ncbi:MAG: pyridoxamine 5'-phosphate oxidase family protein [Firmicutes bacterium]|nr:pyridoxamine 5'-phosphate oxidase family protein [Bacillota bacterium]